ncbi:hypothetical protein, partial [Nonomuraea sp. LPB2021202275-12-8]|uniref:hypothetical protein n=1 Tax=Nonomuraea sp. LPB2021202275-12-8 TaxID=3120159 RepID=UPI00300C38B5
EGQYLSWPARSGMTVGLEAQARATPAQRPTKAGTVPTSGSLHSSSGTIAATHRRAIVMGSGGMGQDAGRPGR